jgi:hypothetical protein
MILQKAVVHLFPSNVFLETAPPSGQLGVDIARPDCYR